MKVMSVEEAQMFPGCWGSWEYDQGWGQANVQVIFIHEFHNSLLNIYLCLELT